MRSVPPLVFVALFGSVACAPAGSSAYISSNVPVSAECIAGDGDITLPTGLYDVLSDASKGKKAACLRPYQMALTINSNLQGNSNLAVGRAEPNALLVNYADISLLDKNEALLTFPAGRGEAPPNPYRVYTAVSIPPAMDENPSIGWVTIDAIPTAYADGLRQAFAGDSILVEVQLFGKTTGDTNVDFAPFLYPIAICSDCLSTCKNDARWMSDPAALTELNADKCDDGRPQDGRYCIVDGC